MNENERSKPETGDVIHCGKHKGDFKKIVTALVDDGWFLTVGRNIDGHYVIRIEDRPGDNNGAV